MPFPSAGGAEISSGARPLDVSSPSPAALDVVDDSAGSPSSPDDEHPATVNTRAKATASRTLERKVLSMFPLWLTAAAPRAPRAHPTLPLDGVIVGSPPSSAASGIGAAVVGARRRRMAPSA